MDYYDNFICDWIIYPIFFRRKTIKKIKKLIFTIKNNSVISINVITKMEVKMRYRYYHEETATRSEWFSCEETEPEMLAKSLGYEKFVGMADFVYFYVKDDVELIIDTKRN